MNHNVVTLDVLCGGLLIPLVRVGRLERWKSLKIGGKPTERFWALVLELLSPAVSKIGLLLRSGNATKMINLAI